MFRQGFLGITFIVLNVCRLLAQTGSLEGTVRDSAGMPVELASISLTEARQGTITDNKGHYEFHTIPPGTYSVVLSLMGYQSVQQKIQIKDGQTAELDFQLKQKVHVLGELVVHGIRNISGIGHLDEVHDGIIYSGKKNEVLILDSLDANTAQNNSRQVLGRVPGSNYSETEGGGFPSSGIGFRGLNPVQSVETNTRQNGYNISADLYGYPESYYLPPLEAVERIEVIRGASSLQFGPQFGGMINYFVRKGPEDKKFEFTTEQTAGSYGLFNSFNAAGGTLGKWNYYTYVQAKTSDGWRQNSAYKQILGFARLEYKASEKLKIGLEYSMLRNCIRMPGGLSDAQFNQDSHQSFRQRNWLNSPWNIVALTAEYKVSSNTLITFKSALNISSRNLVWKNEDGGPERSDSISTLTHTYVQREVQRESFLSSTSEIRLLQTYTLWGQAQNLSAGVRYFQGSMKRQGGGPGSTGMDFDLNLYGGTYEYDLDFLTTNIAPFLENTFHLGKRLSVTPGFRFEYLWSSAKGYVTDTSSVLVTTNRSQARSFPLAGLGMQFKTGTSSNIYANCSQAYRPTDYANQTPLGVSSKIDPNLKDASGYNADLGWRGMIRNFLNFDLGGFYMAYNNRIGLESLTDAGGNIYTYRTNVANSVHQGVEGYVELNFVKLLAKDPKPYSLSVFNSCAYIDARYVSGSFKGNWVEFAPNLINRSGLTVAYKNFSTTFLVSYTSQSYADANNTVFSPDATIGIIPSYAVMDWSATFRYKRYNFKCGINNLADAKYFTLRTDEYPGPGIIPSVGRSFYVGIGARF